MYESLITNERTSNVSRYALVSVLKHRGFQLERKNRIIINVRLSPTTTRFPILREFQIEHTKCKKKKQKKKEEIIIFS